MKSQKKSKDRLTPLEEDKETRIKIGNRIKSLRKEKGRSQENFAYENDIDRKLVSLIENGETNFEWSTLLKFIRALEVTMQEFFEGIEY